MLDALIAGLAEAQYGVFARQQAIDLGFSARQIRQRCASGKWETVLPGVYRIVGAPSQSRQAAMAACLWAGTGAVVSHSAAGVLWDLDGFSTTRVEISVPRERRLRTPKLVVHRTLSLPSVDCTELGSIPITTPARTVIDSAPSLDDETLEAAVECGLRRGLFTERFLAWRLDQLTTQGRAGIPRLRALLRSRREEAALESRLEVKAWRLLVRSGLPRPVRQHWIEIDGHRYRIDFAWPDRRVAVEAEGRIAHGGRRRPFYDDRARRVDLVSRDWRIVPITWEDVETRPDEWLTKLAKTLALAA